MCQSIKVAKDSDREKNQTENLKGEPEMAMENNMEEVGGGEQAEIQVINTPPII